MVNECVASVTRIIPARSPNINISVVVEVLLVVSDEYVTSGVGVTTFPRTFSDEGAGVIANCMGIK